ncbi:MAG TPA: hypothetical protein VFX97_18030 [Pyrinomonadaceae bacterium]|nr:hypothetical protein [Pyrinomonadaceae bacterium]
MRKQKAIFAAVFSLIAVVSTLVVTIWLKRGTNSAPPPRIEVIQITIRPTGFEPSDLQHPSQPFLLSLDNQSGLDNLTLEMYREAGPSLTRIYESKLSLRSLRKREIQDLEPGSYVLKEANHPRWACRITITPK